MPFFCAGGIARVYVPSGHEGRNKGYGFVALENANIWPSRSATAAPSWSADILISRAPEPRKTFVRNQTKV
jgi:hypothetical protein